MTRTFFFLILLLSLPALAERVQRTVSLDWDPIPGAASYEAEIVKTFPPAPKSEPIQTKTSEIHWTVDLEPGTYQLRVRSRDRRQVPGHWSAPQEIQVNLEPIELQLPEKDAKLMTGKTEEAPVSFQWRPVAGADFYSFEIVSDDGKVKISKALKDPKLQLILPVAKSYNWKLQASNGQGLNSGMTASSNFTLWGAALEKPLISVAENGFVRDLQWTRPFFSEHFHYTLSRWESGRKAWIDLEDLAEFKDSAILFENKWPKGFYRLTLSATAPYRVDSPRVVKQFKVMGGDRSPAQETNTRMKIGINRGRGWYGMASYLVTSMNYSGVNSDNGGAAKLRVNLPNNFGGTGRFGVGYLGPESPWGWVGILDLSGFQVAGQNPLYASLEGNGIYRQDLGRAELRHQLGLFYKELPEIIAHDLSSIDRVDKISSLGVHYGAEYWFAATERVGLQANLHLYQSQLSVKTPSGNALKPNLSYQAGLMGSYRFSEKWTGLAGYAYRKDSAAYESSSGQENTVEVTGHYLNLFLEWAL